MAHLSRRSWLQKSLLASSAMLVGGPGTALLARPQRPSPKYFEPDYIRLNSNENPYGPSPRAREAMIQSLDRANRYPFDDIGTLKEALAQQLKVKPEEILLTAGSTEVLSLLGQHVGLLKGEMVLPWPSFPTALRFGEACGASMRKVDLDKKDRVDLDALLSAIGPNTTMVYLCNPNNPTSTEVDADDLRAFCRAVPSDVLIGVDEAYIEYSKKGLSSSLVPLIHELPNLIICRTFSKVYGLAGLRIGYAVSSQDNIAALRARHLGREMATGVLPVAAAQASLDNTEFLQKCIEKNEEARQMVYQAFDKWGVHYADSSTSFLYVRNDRFPKDVRAQLRKDNILITQWADMTRHIRISIGKPEEMELFLQAMEKYVS
jgi:histidinol-phosphate aminotransferase